MRRVETQVLVIGGGTSGVCAAIQAARLGIEVVLVEETAWLGGMLTAAGVSAIDGNHRLPSGLWAEFRQKLYDYYGGPEAVETGWVSNTLFEPHVAESIFRQMTCTYDNLQVYKGYRLQEMTISKGRVQGAGFVSKDNEILKVNASVTIDATELGDALYLAGCNYRVGRESREMTGETYAPAAADSILQDITVVATLKDYGEDADRTIDRPEGYDAEQYTDCCKLSNQPGANGLHTPEKMLEYGRLPNQKYMINWPIWGNDYYLDGDQIDRDKREVMFKKARQFTQGFVYYIQTELGYSHLGIAEDEFPTGDGLAMIPYIRESRRVRGQFTLKSQHIENPYQYEVFQHAIAVGDYPLDHHHQKAPLSTKVDFPRIPSFSVPYGCLVPSDLDGFLVAEKNISVTHMVNGCTRLQPCVMLIGQAAGAAAALCAMHKLEPRKLPVRRLQSQLLSENCYLLPFLDTDPGDPYFHSLQRIGVCGILKGECSSKQWVNQTRIYPERPVTQAEFFEALSKVVDIPKVNNRHKKALSIGTALQICHRIKGQIDDCQKTEPYARLVKRYKLDLLKDSGNAKQQLTRKHLAYLLDRIFDPFRTIPVSKIEDNQE